MEEQLKMYDEIFRVVGESLEEKLTKLNYENYEKLDSTDLGKEKKKKFNEKIEEYFSMYRDTTRRDSTEPGYVAFKEKLSYLNKKLKDEGKDQIENAEDFFNFKKKLEEEKEKEKHDTPNDESKSDDAPKHVDTEPSKKMPDKKGKVNSWWAENIKPTVKRWMKFVGGVAGVALLASSIAAPGNIPLLLLLSGVVEGVLLGVKELPTVIKFVTLLPRKGIDFIKSLKEKSKEKQKGKKKNKKRKKQKSNSSSRESVEDYEKTLSEGMIHDDEKKENDISVDEKTEEDMTTALDNIPTDEKSEEDKAEEDMTTALDNMLTDEKSEEDKVDDISTDDKSKSDVTPDLPVSNADIKEQREQKIQRLKNTKQRLVEAKERLRKQKEEQTKQENGVQDKSDVVTHSSGTHENIIDRQLNALADNHVGYTGNYDETDLEKRIIVEDELKKLNEQIAQLSNSRNYDGNYDETEIEKQALIERKNQLEKFIMSKKSPAMQTAVIDDVRTQSRISKLPSQSDDVEKINSKINELSSLLGKSNYVPEAEKNKDKEYIELSRELEELKKTREKIIQQKNIESIQQSENQEEFSRKM